MPFRCNLCHDTGHLRNSCTYFLHGIPISKGFTPCDPPSRSPPVDSQKTIAVSSLSPDRLYGSSSPALYDDLTKGELLYIEDIENCSHLSPPARIVATPVVSSTLDISPLAAPEPYPLPLSPQYVLSLTPHLSFRPLRLLHPSPRKTSLPSPALLMYHFLLLLLL